MNTVPPPAQQNQEIHTDDGAGQETDPMALFQDWFEQALQSDMKEPRAMSLATVDADGQPDVRMILLKGVDSNGFVFYTNLQSPKAQAIQHDSRVALCFYWPALDKQVRIRGHASPVSNEEADAYFLTRPRLSRISAWASKQSQPMRGYFELEAEVAKTMLRFGMNPIPRPPFWSGFRVVPRWIEFWDQKPFRRHRRIAYERLGAAWQKHWLYP